MGGQVVGGGIVVVVAAVLWLAYLLPSWASRRRYDAAERNAVRLNQALRVLAETSETPEEVRLELTTRTAHAQQRLARKALAEREEDARRAQSVQDALAAQALRERQEAELARGRAELEHARAERLQAHAAHAAARALPVTRLARARRRARLTATLLMIACLGVAGWGVLDLVTAGDAVLVWGGGVGAVVCGLVLVRMARVSARAVVRVAAPDSVSRVAAEAQDLAVGDERGWQPRELPRPLTASAGSRAAAVLDGAAQQERLRQAAMDEALRERAENTRPALLEPARLARAAATDDAEIEAHVRELLRRRAAG